jgi:hypothetical protein
MANSKLLKEAIADAKAVKETALANAKLALEEAFTPRLQSILSQKMRAEAEEAEVEDDEKMKNEELNSDGIGSKVDAGYPETPGAQPNYSANTDLSVGVKKASGKPEQSGTDYKKVADISEEENPYGDDAMAGDDAKDKEIAELRARLAELEGEDSEEEMPADDAMAGDDADMSDEFSMGPDSDDQFGDDEMGDESEDDMDLEAIIRELEAQLGNEEGSEDDMGSDEDPMAEIYHDGDEAGTDKSEDPAVKMANEEKEEDDKEMKDEVIDLEEILREMEADMKDDKEKEEVKEEEDKEEMKKELNEAYRTIKSLQSTINEVNLLNAKLLFANKLFRAHNMTNEQKVKVIETLDRTKSVREVKLVYSTLAENFKYSTSNKSTKKSISEGIASKVTKSTKPAASKQVIAENTQFSDRFKKLAGIIK